MIMEDNIKENEMNILIRKFAGHLAQVYIKHIDEMTPSLTKQKEKLLKIKPTQSLKPYERSGYKIVDSPLLQMFKQPEEDFSTKVKNIKKLNKGSINTKKRNIKNNKVSNLYFDPEGDSVKRYRELYTFKNSPGIRTVTNIQEAVKIYNETLQKARMKKNYLGRIKRKKEERTFTEPQMNNSLNKIIYHYSPNRVMKMRSLQPKDLNFQIIPRKPQTEEPNLNIQRKLQRIACPSKDFLERNKLRKSKVEKPYNQCDSLAKSSPIIKLPLLPSQEFLNRNMPKKFNEEGEFSNSFSEYLLRVKTNVNTKKPLPVPVVKIGFPEDNASGNSEVMQFSQKIGSKEILFNTKYNDENLFKSQIIFNDTFTLEKGELVPMAYKESNTIDSEGLQKFSLDQRRDISQGKLFRPSESYSENFEDLTNKEENYKNSTRENFKTIPFSIVNVGFQMGEKSNFEKGIKITKCDDSSKVPLFTARPFKKTSDSISMVDYSVQQTSWKEPTFSSVHDNNLKYLLENMNEQKCEESRTVVPKTCSNLLVNSNRKLSKWKDLRECIQRLKTANNLKKKITFNLQETFSDIVEKLPNKFKQ